MRIDHVTCLGTRGFHRMQYVEWGDPAAERVVVCVHGLTRNGRDFDTFARALPEFRVICPDVVGRGGSDWLTAPEDYGYVQYCADLTVLLGRVTAADGGRPRRVYWVGTSMGGILGMLLASRPKTPIERLVVNDVGAFIPAASLERLGTYVGKDPRFGSLREAEAYMRLVCAPFGPLTGEQWRHLTEHSVSETDGSWRMAYDPAIGIPFRAGEPMKDVDLWQPYDAIRCPTLLVRGAQSDLLLAETAAEMAERGPRARLVTFQGIGHAPMLMADDQIAAVRGFLLEG